MIIAPSLLAANCGRLASEVARLQRAGADWLHVDVMDGHFVPNISFGPAVVQALRPLARMDFDVHLMCSRPEVVIEPFAKAGADLITVHVELGSQVESLIWKIRSLGRKVGLAINPPTAVGQLEPFLGKVDLILIMTVNPGFGGQSFIHETLPKMQQVAAWRQQCSLDYHIEVDGGINFATARECALAGADTFVSGTFLLRHYDMKGAIRKMRKITREAHEKHPPSAGKSCKSCAPA